MCFAKCYWPMDLGEPFVRERPFWFDEAWKARIPPEFLVDIEHAAALVSPQEATFRESVRGAEPWSLDAQQLSAWLQENWVSSESEPAEFREQTRRRELV